MKRVLTTAIVAAAVMAPLVPATQAQALIRGHRWRECRYQTSDGSMGWSRSDVHKTIECALEHWPVAGGFSYADYIADRESGDRAIARNSYSGACGIYQSLPSLWPTRISWFHRVTGWPVMQSCFNARSNVLWAIRYVHTYGWGPWGG